MNTVEKTFDEYVKDHAQKCINGAIKRYVQDIRALNHEGLSKSWNGTRTGYDISYEVAIINTRMAKRCKGEDPGPMPWEFGKEWLKAPEAFQNPDAIVNLLEESGSQLIEAAGEDMRRMVEGMDGIVPVYQALLSAALHTIYHGGQLNFIQELNGDMDVHWA